MIKILFISTNIQNDMVLNGQQREKYRSEWIIRIDSSAWKYNAKIDKWSIGN